jgi:hypothetical protein
MPAYPRHAVHLPKRNLVGFYSHGGIDGEPVVAAGNAKYYIPFHCRPPPPPSNLSLYLNSGTFPIFQSNIIRPKRLHSVRQECELIAFPSDLSLELHRCPATMGMNRHKTGSVFFSYIR